MLFGASNALTKWLKADLLRLPTDEGEQPGVKALQSDKQKFSWQLHIIENRYKSYEKTVIATEANSRFTILIPVDNQLFIDELTQRLLMEWQYVLAETLEQYGLLPRNEIVQLLSELDDVEFKVEWVKNTDLSINGHITDAGLWVTQTLDDRNLKSLPPELTLELAIYLNTQTKRIKKRYEKFVPVERLLTFWKQSLIVTDKESTSVFDNITKINTSNVVFLKRIESK